MNPENNPAAKGLAYNNATADARTVGKESDKNYILNRYIFHRNLSALCQSSDDDMIMEVLNEGS